MEKKMFSVALLFYFCNVSAFSTDCMSTEKNGYKGVAPHNNQCTWGGIAMNENDSMQDVADSTEYGKFVSDATQNGIKSDFFVDESTGKEPENWTDKNQLGAVRDFPLSVSDFRIYSSVDNRLVTSSKLLNWGDTLYVSYQQKILSFQFDIPENVDYHYFYSFSKENYLRKNHANWYDIGDFWQIVISDLCPGNYRLQIKALCGTKTLVKEVYIVRTPIWSETALFKFLCFASIVSVLSAIFLYCKKKSKKKKENIRQEIDLKANLLLEEKQKEVHLGDPSLILNKIERLVDSLPAENDDDIFGTKVKSCVIRNLANEQFTVSELGQMVGYSRVQFFRKFKESFNMPPSEYIRKYRMTYALKLLSQGNLRVSEVSFMCGYSDPNCFARTFSKEFGQSPSNVKKHVQNLKPIDNVCVNL